MRYPNRSHLFILSVLLIQLCGTTDCKSAEQTTDHALIAMTDEVRGMCQEAERLINARKFKEAEQVLKRAENIDPNCAEVHGYLGMAYQNSLRTQQAVTEYSQALQLNPQMSFIKVNLGTCYMNLNQLDQAVPYFEQYLQENPGAPDAQQVRSYIQQAGSRRGQQGLRQTVERGQALLNQHKYREACGAFEQAIAQQPNFAPAHFFLGFALGQSGQNQRAIAEFQTCLQIDPSLKDAILNIGSNYQSLGDCGNAIVWYERFLQENPSSPKAGDIRQRISGLRQQLSEQGGRPAGRGNNFAMPPGPGAMGNNYSMPPNSGGMGNNYSMPPNSGGLGNNYSMPPNSGGMGNNYSMPPNAEGMSNNYSMPPDDYLSSVCPGGRHYRWTNMPIRVYIAPGNKNSGYRDSFSQALKEAFSKWASASENRVSFVFLPDPDKADIACNWTGDPNKIMESGRSVEGGLAKLSGQPQPNGDVNITSVKITILTNRSGQEISDDDMKKVCLHEVGHGIGINGHSNNNSDVMFFSESPTVWPSLTKRDKATICRLYANYPQH